MSNGYTVVVGNIGTVCDNVDYADANHDYIEYVNQSADGYGRAAGEDVTMMHDGDVYKEYVGTVHDGE